jgi:hypothetical protein
MLRLVMSGSSGRPPLLLFIGFAVFLLVIAYLVAASLTPTSVQVFELVDRPARARPSREIVRDTLTVDARDETRWRYVSLATGGPVDPGDRWDLAVRRFTIVPFDAAIDLGNVPFEQVRNAPGGSWISTTPAPNMANAAFRHWYRYGLISHLLTPSGHVYAIRVADGRYAKLEILGYYCPGPVAGCLTFRYVYQPDGTARLD